MPRLGALRRGAAKHKAVSLELFAVMVVEFIPMPMALTHTERPIQLGGERTGGQLAFVETQPHRATFLRNDFLFLLQINDGMRRLGVELGRIRFRQTHHITTKLNASDLETQTQSKISYLLLAGVARRENLTFDTPLSETTWHHDAPHRLEITFGTVTLDFLGFHLDQLDAAIVGNPTVSDGFVHRLVRVLQLDILAHDGDAHAVLRRDDAANDVLPQT